MGKTILIKARKQPYNALRTYFGYYRVDSRDSFTRVEGLHGPIGYATKEAALEGAAHMVRVSSKAETGR